MNMLTQRERLSPERIRTLLEDILCGCSSHSQSFLDGEHGWLDAKELHTLNSRGYISHAFQRELSSLKREGLTPDRLMASSLLVLAGRHKAEELFPLFEALKRSAHQLGANWFSELVETKHKTNPKLVAEVIDTGWKGEICLANVIEVAQAFRSIYRIQALRSFADSRGQPILESLAALGRFARVGGTLDSLQRCASLRNSLGQRLFDCEGDILDFHCLSDEKRTVAIQLTKLRDPQGLSVFGFGSDLVDYAAHRGTAEFALKIAAIKDRAGKRAFDGYEVALLHEAGISEARARRWASRGIDATSGVVRHKAGISNSRFRHNGQPRCLLLLPGHDHTQFGMRAFLDESLGFFRNLRDFYDIKAISTLSRSGLLEQLERHAPELNLLIISEHGERDHIHTGRDRSPYGYPTPKEELSLQVGDKRLAAALTRLPFGCTIFLNSCLTADEAGTGEHFAGFVARHAPQCHVFASEVPITSTNLHIESMLPFEPVIIDVGIKDRTFHSAPDTGVLPRRNLREESRGQMGSLNISQDLPSAVYVHPLPRPGNEDGFYESLAALDLNSYLIRYLKELALIARKMARLDGVTILHKRNLRLDHSQSAWQYIFGERWAEPWCAPRDGPGLRAARIVSDHVNRLRELGFSPAINPADGDLVVYYINRGSSSAELMPIHFGEYRDKGVISKFRWTHVMHHPLECGPRVMHDMGDSLVVVFYRRNLAAHG